METKIRALYKQEIETAQLDFERDPEYQAYYTQAEALWEGADMPEPVYHLLDASSYCAFAHGLRVGMELAGWLRS